MATEFELNSPLAQQRWSNSLAVETETQQYFRKFMGTDRNSPVLVLKDLERKAGEKITHALRIKLTGDGVENDDIIQGTSAEQDLNFYSDHLYIGQRRKGTKSKGKMSEQRIAYNIRQHGRDALATWFAEDIDQQIFLYACGIPSASTALYNTTYPFTTLNPGYHIGNSWTGRANNNVGFVTQADGKKISAGVAVSHPYIDSEHHFFGGTATAYNTITTSDIMEVGLVEKAVALIDTIDPHINPIRINGEDKYVLLMHPFQAHSMRSATSENDWLEIHKATDSKDSIIYKNALGEYAGVVLHKHRNIIRYIGGASANIAVGRALLLGAQAVTLAFGGASQYGRYSWNEEYDDRGNALVITVGAIYGVERCSFNSKAFGLIAIDTVCVAP